MVAEEAPRVLGDEIEDQVADSRGERGDELQAFRPGNEEYREHEPGAEEGVGHDLAELAAYPFG